MATAFGSTYRFRAPGTPGRIARWACLGSAGILVITGAVALVRAATGAEWRVRLFLPPEGSSAQPATSELYPGALGAIAWIGAIAFVVTAVCWLAWQVRATENVWAVPGTPAPTKRPGMAALWWFIPFANLGMPYVCVRELRAVSAARAGAQPRRGLVATWWTLWLAANLASLAAAVWMFALFVDRLVESGPVIEGAYVIDLSPATWALGAWHVLLAGSALAGAGVVGEIERLQGRMLSQEARPERSPTVGAGAGAPAPPRPDLG